MTESTTKTTEREPWQDKNGRDIRMTLKTYSREGFKAFKRHTTYLKAEEQSFPNAMLGFRLDQDITLYHRDIKLNGGPDRPPYYHPINNYEGAPLYVLVVNPLLMEQVNEALNNDDQEQATRLLNNLSLKLTPCTSKKDGEPVTFTDLAISAAIQDAIEIKDKKLVQRLVITARYGFKPALNRVKRARKENTAATCQVLTTTKEERVLFGEVEREERLSLDNFLTGIAVQVEHPQLKARTSLSVMLEADALMEIEQMEETERALTPEMRDIMHAGIAILKDNPEKIRLYGSDFLTRQGVANPLDKGNEAKMQRAFDAVRKQTKLTVTVDNTAEAQAYEGLHNGKKIVRRITERRLIDGTVSAEEYEGGGKDWFIDLNRQPYDDIEKTFPLYGLAQDKGQVRLLELDIFAFPNCGRVSDNARRCMRYIYEQAGAVRRKNKETIYFATMFDRLNIKGDPDKLRKLKAQLPRLLDSWVSRGYCDSWNRIKDGRVNIGLRVYINPQKNE